MPAEPIKFSNAMVVKVLNGEKSQTRRKVKGELFNHQRLEDHLNSARNQRLLPGSNAIPIDNLLKLNRFGQPGDRLWVSEWIYVVEHRTDGTAIVHYEADNTESCVVTPADRIPLEPYECHQQASRILLKINDVRLEPLQAISEEDAKAEGVVPTGGRTHIAAFKDAWISLYSEEDWASNPWVWVIDFEQVKSK